jgi:ribonuclease P protein component
MDAGGSAAGGGSSFPGAARITDADEIRALFRRGKRRKTRHLDVFVSASPVLHCRLGLVVPKPRGKFEGGRVRAPAVRRNRLKRRLREIGRTILLPDLNSRGCAADLLLRARPEAYAATFPELREELKGVLEWICSSVR